MGLGSFERCFQYLSERHQNFVNPSKINWVMIHQRWYLPLWCSGNWFYLVLSIISKLIKLETWIRPPGLELGALGPRLGSLEPRLGSLVPRLGVLWPRLRPLESRLGLYSHDWGLWDQDWGLWGQDGGSGAKIWGSGANGLGFGVKIWCSGANIGGSGAMIWGSGAKIGGFWAALRKLLKKSFKWASSHYSSFIHSKVISKHMLTFWQSSWKKMGFTKKRPLGSFEKWWVTFLIPNGYIKS